MVGMIPYIHILYPYISLSIEGSNQGSMFLGLPEVCHSITQTRPFLDKLWILAFNNKLKMILNLLSFAQAHCKCKV